MKWLKVAFTCFVAVVPDGHLCIIFKVAACCQGLHSTIWEASFALGSSDQDASGLLLCISAARGSSDPDPPRPKCRGSCSSSADFPTLGSGAFARAAQTCVLCKINCVLWLYTSEKGHRRCTSNLIHPIGGQIASRSIGFGSLPHLVVMS